MTKRRIIVRRNLREPTPQPPQEPPPQPPQQSAGDRCLRVPARLTPPPLRQITESGEEYYYDRIRRELRKAIEAEEAREEKWDRQKTYIQFCLYAAAILLLFAVPHLFPQFFP